jgi:hypothetical protein
MLNGMNNIELNVIIYIIKALKEDWYMYWRDYKQKLYLIILKLI